MATATGQHPFTSVLRARTAAVATVGNDADTAVGRVSGQGVGTVTSVVYIPDAALSGANTNSRTVTLYNRGAAGSGTTVVAQLALTSGVNLAAFVPKTITLSGTAANLDLADG